MNDTPNAVPADLTDEQLARELRARGWECLEPPQSYTVRIRRDDTGEVFYEGPPPTAAELPEGVPFSVQLVDHAGLHGPWGSQFTVALPPHEGADK